MSMPSRSIAESRETNRSMLARAQAVTPSAGLGGSQLPDGVNFVFARGAGPRFWDVEDREYVDYVGGAGALILGHSHPAVVAAMQAQTARGAHMYGVLNDVAIRLAERLVADIPCAEKIAYATTGSEATAYCMRLARAFTGRDLVLKFEGAYHGNHDYALASTFPTLLGNDPHGQDDTGGRPAGTRSTMLVAPYNDAEAVRRIVRERKGEIAAIIVEPVQRIIPAEPEFLTALRTICDQNGIVLIFDEVVCGFRLAYGGAQAFFGVTPDLASYGKVVGAGGPMSCIAGKAAILDLANPAMKGKRNYAYFNGTLHGNPIAAAATFAMLDELSKPGTYDRLNAYSDTVSADMQKVLDRHGLRARVEHTGSLWQILFLDRKPRTQADMLDNDAAAMRRLDVELLKRSQSVLPGVRRFFSCVHGGSEVEELLRALDESCRAIR